MKKYRGVAVGAGYFSHFQYEAWSRIDNVDLVAICDQQEDKAIATKDNFGIKSHYTDFKVMIDQEKPDFIDIITPPESHFEISQYAADRGVHIICQKPLAPTFEDTLKMVDYTQKEGVRFMVHENWRFQPWYREIKLLLEQQTIGEVHTVNFRKRMGDGWGPDAYLARQPYFRDYERLIVYENGIHFIDTFRYLFGEVKEVYAKLRTLNPAIRGEDWAMIHFTFENGTQALWDANRYNEPNYDNPRYTFGEMLIDGLEGSIRLYHDGRITIQKLGENEIDHQYHHEDVNFSGDSVFNTQKHFINAINQGISFETNGQDYLKSLSVQEAVYQSAKENAPKQPQEPILNLFL